MVEGNVVKPIQTKFQFRTERHVGKVRTLPWKTYRATSRFEGFVALTFPIIMLFVLSCTIFFTPSKHTKVGVMLVGLGGNNGWYEPMLLYFRQIILVVGPDSTNLIVLSRFM